MHVSARKKPACILRKSNLVSCTQFYVYPICSVRSFQQRRDCDDSCSYLEEFLRKFRILPGHDFEFGVFMTKMSACFRNRQIPMQATGTPQNDTTMRKSAKFGVEFTVKELFKMESRHSSVPLGPFCRCEWSWIDGFFFAFTLMMARLSYLSEI